MSDYRVEKHRIVAGTTSSGMDVAYVKSRQVIVLSGWYDGGYGCLGSPVEIPLDEFLKALEIPEPEFFCYVSHGDHCAG